LAVILTHGGLTDVRYYIDIIPECTNISIGYYHQHRRNEWVDTAYLKALRWAVIKVQARYHVRSGKERDYRISLLGILFRDGVIYAVSILDGK
jgi:hypothetical protein